MKTKILVVDDDPTIVKLLEFELQQEGYEVIEARDEQGFRDLALSEHPDLIILDIMLGSRNGALIYNDLLVHGLDRKIPVIFLTGLAQDRPPSPAHEGRTYALYSKPFKREELIEEITRLVHH